jgi:hypothetical protein
MLRAMPHSSRPGVVRYLPFAGTHHATEGWVIGDPTDPFTFMMLENGFEPIRAEDGSPFLAWDGSLTGLFPWEREKAWHVGADRAEKFLSGLPIRDRNLIGHSHGGQPIVIMASRGFPINTATTVGTPRRKDLDADAAVKYIGMWQHIYDADKDWIATLSHEVKQALPARVRQTLGGIGDFRRSDRSFSDVPGVRRYPIKGISHSKLFREAEHLPKWRELGWLQNIRDAAR